MTGMAATSAVMSAFLKAGDHCVITNCSYGGTQRICRELYQAMGVSFSFVDFSNLAEVEAAIQPNTRLMFSESPANPVLRLCDIQALSDLAKAKGVVHVCDSTFATPIINRPLDFGADLTLVSLTKFYDGHNINTGGALICRTPELYQKVHLHRNMHGSILPAMTAFMILQTMKTMKLRVVQQSANALAIAQFLETHPKVLKAVYPGLASFPQKELADRQHSNGLHGSMLWFEIQGGSPAGIKLMDCIGAPWSLCENLGATESIITACAVMTHANISAEARAAVGITDGFIRVSCGIEDVEDLISSLNEALAQC
jgi:cystathionine beta-lyase/cystathionine gamma-synthase